MTYLERDELRKQTRRENLNRANREYYRRNVAVLRAKAKERDEAKPQLRRARTQRFELQNPSYWRQYYHRRKLRIAWLAFVRVCAANRLTTRRSP